MTPNDQELELAAQRFASIDFDQFNGTRKNSAWAREFDSFKAGAAFQASRTAQEIAGLKNGWNLAGKHWITERLAMEERMRKLEAVMRNARKILESPMWPDQATVPMGGVEACPEQVVLNASIGLIKIRNLEDAIHALDALGETK